MGKQRVWKEPQAVLSGPDHSGGAARPLQLLFLLPGIILSMAALLVFQVSAKRSHLHRAFLGAVCVCVRVCVFVRVHVRACVWWGVCREELSDHRTFQLAILALFSYFSVTVLS